MPGNATDIFQEGLRIPPVKLVNKGKVNTDILNLILTNSRTPKIRKGDLMAQLSANWTGEKRLVEIIDQKGIAIYKHAIDEILDYSERRFLASIKDIPEMEAEAIDYMEIFNPKEELVKIAVKIKIAKGKVVFDFTGTSKQVAGAINCPYAVTLSGAYYVLRCITDPSIPANEGLYRHLEVIVPVGSLLNALPPAAVVGGNVETSQRVVDSILRAFAQIMPDKIPAASQGTMNNLIIGGTDEQNQPFTFYETIGGGSGGRKHSDGVDGIHTNMTNTMNTPVEEIEARYPMKVLEYSFRENSGGKGEFRGGLGLVRKIKVKVPVIVSLLGERQQTSPWGLNKGEDGKRGYYYKTTKDGQNIPLKSKATTTLTKDEIITIETPGGGGWGSKKNRIQKLTQEDKMDEKMKNR
jgi:N-methylhydantoinase B